MARQVITKERRQLILGLQAVGGKISANGKGRLGPNDVRQKLGLNSPHPTQLLARAEKDGIIKRVIHAKYTKSIALVTTNPFVQKVLESAPIDIAEPAERPKPRRVSRQALRMPELGTTVEIAMLSVDRDGRTQLGLRNSEGSWMTTVDGFAAAPQAE